MSLEFVVFDANGMGVDWVIPYNGHTENGDGSLEVRSGYNLHHITIPGGGRYSIRQRFDS